MTRRGGLRLTLLTGAGLLALAGCSRPFVSALAVPPYRDQAPASYDATWHALVRALAMDNVPLRTVAKDSGVIATEDFVSPIGVYADCGRLGDDPLEGDALVAFTIFVRPAPSSPTDLQINAKMRTQSYRRRGAWGGHGTEPVHQCVSTGRWEANLGDSVRRLVRE